jgi:hypothetical protein
VRRDLIVIALALIAGALLAAYDLRTDDTGIEAGLLLIAFVALTALAPRRWWLIALLVVGPIPRSWNSSRGCSARPRAPTVL